MQRGVAVDALMEGARGGIRIEDRVLRPRAFRGEGHQCRHGQHEARGDGQER